MGAPLMATILPVGLLPQRSRSADDARTGRTVTGAALGVPAEIGGVRSVEGPPGVAYGAVVLQCDPGLLGVHAVGVVDEPIADQRGHEAVLLRRRSEPRRVVGERVLRQCCRGEGEVHPGGIAG